MASSDVLVPAPVLKNRANFLCPVLPALGETALQPLKKGTAFHFVILTDFSVLSDGGRGKTARSRNELTHPDGYNLGDAGLRHGDAVEDLSRLHGLFVVGDQHELGNLAHFLDYIVEPIDVGIVQRRVDFV